MHDLATMQAAEIFEVRPEDVTPEQRQFAKTRYFLRDYETGVSKLEKTPRPVFVSTAALEKYILVNLMMSPTGWE